MMFQRHISALAGKKSLWIPLISSYRPLLRPADTQCKPRNVYGIWRHNSTNAPPLELREYQQECVDSCLESLREGKRRLAVSMATGGGKTVVFAKLIREVTPVTPGYGNKVLVLAHRKELVEQAARHIRQTNPELNVEIEMGKHMASDEADVIVASVPSLSREPRLHRLDPREFKLIIVDEAHHIIAETYRRILEYFDATTPQAPVPVVGFSATLLRSDGLKLGKAMDYIVYHKGMLDLISDKWLVDVRFSTIKTEAELDKVKYSQTTGDFVVSSLSRELNTPENNELIVKTWLHFREKYSLNATLVFCVDVAHVRDLTDCFSRAGVEAHYAVGSTRLEERTLIVQRFRNGEFPVLLNCGVFTEGTDIPNIDLVLLARPTYSQSLLTQMLGRGLRLHPEKTVCHVVDFVSVSNIGIVTVPTLAGLDPDTMVDGMTLAEMAELKKLRREQRKAQLEAAKAEQGEEQESAEEAQEAQELVPIAKPKPRNTTPMDKMRILTYEGLDEFLKSIQGGQTEDISELLNSGDPQGYLGGVGAQDNLRRYAVPIGRSRNAWLETPGFKYFLSDRTGDYLKLHLIDEGHGEIEMDREKQLKKQKKKKKNKKKSKKGQKTSAEKAESVKTEAEGTKDEEKPKRKVYELVFCKKTIDHWVKDDTLIRQNLFSKEVIFKDIIEPSAALKAADIAAASLLLSNFTLRDASWRSNSASSKQQAFVLKTLKSRLNSVFRDRATEGSDELKQMIEAELESKVQKMNRGTAFDLITSFSLGGTDMFSNMLKKLTKRHRDILREVNREKKKAAQEKELREQEAARKAKVLAARTRLSQVEVGPMNNAEAA